MIQPRYLLSLAALHRNILTTRATSIVIMSKKRTLQNYFSAVTSSSSKKIRTVGSKNPTAELLAQRIEADIHYLTPDGLSWYLLKRKWLPSTTTKNGDMNTFDQEWNLHPTKRHTLKLFGKAVQEKRWSQSWGVSYSYSGSTNVGRPVPKSSVVEQLIRTANDLTLDAGIVSVENPYNACLQNWYQPDDAIGLHSDDERSQRKECPIFSLSWGGTRRFVFRKRGDKTEKTEVLLRDGDLLVMGGTCQETHYHEVPKLRKTMDPPTSNRINWTIRAFHTDGADKK